MYLRRTRLNARHNEGCELGERVVCGTARHAAEYMYLLVEP
jgi:hypothetical protein